MRWSAHGALLTHTLSDMKLIRTLSCILATGFLFSCGGGGGGSGETTQAPETIVPSAPEAPLAVRTCVLSTGSIYGDGIGEFSLTFKFRAEGGSVTGNIDECFLNIPSLSVSPLRFTGGTWLQRNESTGDTMSALNFTCEGSENGRDYKIQLFIDAMRMREVQEIDGEIVHMEAMATSASVLLKCSDSPRLDLLKDYFQTSIELNYN